jgi:adenylyltransferase/sulfurtransferase
MPNPFGAPEITVHEVKRKVDGDEYFVWLDVREPHELLRAAIRDYRVAPAPVSRLAQFQAEGLPDEAQNPEVNIVVFCHHGVRSAQVTMWLRQQGWTHVYNMAGGIAAWALEIDPSVGHY